MVEKVILEMEEREKIKKWEKENELEKKSRYKGIMNIIICIM